VNPEAAAKGVEKRARDSLSHGWKNNSRQLKGEGEKVFKSESVQLKNGALRGQQAEEKSVASKRDQSLSSRLMETP
jgi:hypothetical protein